MKSMIKFTLISLIWFFGCQQKQETSTNASNENSLEAERTDETALTRLILSSEEVNRLGIKTVSTRNAALQGAENGLLITVPISALIYDHEGRAWIYTQPRPQVFVRHLANVSSIEGDSAYLSDGPPSGVEVVTAGVTKLFSKQFGFGYFFTLKNQ